MPDLEIPLYENYREIAIESVTVAQLGARRRYAVPRIFYEAGVLSTLFTDFSIQGVPRVLRTGMAAPAAPPIWKRFVARDPGLPAHMVKAFNPFGLRYAWKLKRARSQEAMLLAYLWAGRRLCNLVIREGLPQQGIVYGYNSAAREILMEAKNMDVITILDQTIAPKFLETGIIQETRRQFPGWDDGEVPASARAYAEREADEWQLADIILCGSAFVRDALLARGISGAKCRIVPTGGVSQARVKPLPIIPYDGKRPLRVLFVGSVSLRKGIHVLCKAFEGIPDAAAQCRVVGALHVNHERLYKAAPSAIEFVGLVPHSNIEKHYQWADVFCLPSLCEGSAMVTYEALAYGLPLIVTPNTGAIIRHNQEGLIIRPQNPEDLREAVLTLAENPDILEAMAHNTRSCAAEISFSAYARRLIDAVGLARKEHP